MIEIDIEKIPRGAEIVLDLLSMAGYEAYLVGGCVRDMLMGMNPKDWDICTNARPEIVQELFGKLYTVVPTGIKHGTVTIMVDDEGFEVTTYRIDGDYSDGRRPDTVEYATHLAEDLSRRDFTVNALAYSPETGVVDLYGGLDDMEVKVIGCVGKAEDRFNEDSLRILRALRFASTKGFSLAGSTDRAIRRMYKQMSVLSAERIFSEISKILQGDGAFSILMEYAEVFAFLMPELAPMMGCAQNNPYHSYDVWEHTCRAVNSVPKDEVLRFAALFHDVGKPETKTNVDGVDHFYKHPMYSAKKAEIILKRLKSSNDLIAKVTCLVSYHDAELPNKSSVKRMLNKIDVEQFKQLLKLKEADILAQSDYEKEHKLNTLRHIEKVLSEIESENACFKLKDLAINGGDLIAVGFKPGKEMGKVLNSLLNSVLDDILPNNREALLEQAVILKECNCGNS